MIASLRGPVLSLTAGGAVIECGGVGLAVTLTPAARQRLRPGEEAFVCTHLVVREDSLTLYGFDDAAERDVFVVAQSASGVGPRLALALVSTLGPEGLARAVGAEDVAALTRVPGIGRKGAQKLIIALAGKLAPAGAGGVASGAGSPAGAGAPVADQVQAALVGLGFAPPAAAEAVAAALAQPEAPDQLEGLLRAALQRARAGR